MLPGKGKECGMLAARLGGSYGCQSLPHITDSGGWIDCWAAWVLHLSFGIFGGVVVDIFRPLLPGTAATVLVGVFVVP